MFLNRLNEFTNITKALGAEIDLFYALLSGYMKAILINEGIVTGSKSGFHC